MKQIRVAVIAGLLGLASLYIGLRFGAGLSGTVHPLTKRTVAGIATDARWMDRAAREQEEAPSDALRLIGIAPGMIVADVGAGSGYMTMRLATLVAPAGKVYANDIQPALLRVVQEKARAAGASNVEIVLGSETDARLPEHAIDVALLVDVYHEFQHPQAMLQSIRRSLKAGGRLVLIEYRAEDPSIPIAPTHRMSVRDARTEIEAEGFVFDRVIEQLPRQHLFVWRIP